MAEHLGDALIDTGVNGDVSQVTCAQDIFLNQV